MAFFEYLAALNDLLSSALNKFIKPVGGQGSNDIFPSPKAGLPPNPGGSKAGVVVQDADGSLRARASIVSTRYSLRDDFTGSSLNTALTGTPTFTNGSTIVSGSGTAFSTELTRDHFIKRDSDGEANWTRVRRVISDTSLELESNYPGTSGGSASSKTKWPTTTGSGGSFTVGSSLVNVLSGTTNGSRTSISRSYDNSAIYMAFNGLSVSQRIANQVISVGLFDNVASPAQQIAIVFDGTVNTTLKFRTSFTSAATDIRETTVTLPFGLVTSAADINYVIISDGQQATLMIDGVVVASHHIHLPEPFTTFIAAISVVNNATVTTTTIATDSIYIRSYDPLDAPMSGTGILPTDEIHYVYGTLTSSSTTADQVIVSYTVPSAKTAWLLGWALSFSGAASAAPFKIGKNTVTTEPASPGTADGNIFLAGVTAGNPPTYHSNLVVPVPWGVAADVVKMTVTPSANQSTTWRATLIIVVRKA